MYIQYIGIDIYGYANIYIYIIQFKDIFHV